MITVWSEYATVCSHSLCDWLSQPIVVLALAPLP
jgi:hypothetical protein